MSWDSAAPAAPKSAPNIPGIRMPGQGSISAGTSKSAPNIPGIHMPGQGGKSASAGAPKSAPNIPGIRMPGQGSTSAGTSKSAPNIPGIHMPGQGGKSASAGAPKSAPNIPPIFPASICLDRAGSLSAPRRALPIFRASICPELLPESPLLLRQPLPQSRRPRRSRLQCPGTPCPRRRSLPLLLPRRLLPASPELTVLSTS